MNKTQKLCPEPGCGMNLYQDEGVMRCENIACDYNIAPNNSQPESPSGKNTGKKSLWQILKDIWIALGVIKWVVIGVIALMSAVGILSPTPEDTEEPPEGIYTPAPSESTFTPPTPPVTTTPQESETPTRTTLTGTTNGIEWEYKGEVHNGNPHGNGRQELSNGSHFDGEWSHGKFLNGSGMEISEVGHFVGTFVNGFWSEGILQMHPSGAKYEGTFTHRNGRHYRHGQGRIDFANGDWYEGGWRYDNRHGQGTTFHAATESRQPGVWIDNVLQ